MRLRSNPEVKEEEALLGKEEEGDVGMGRRKSKRKEVGEEKKVLVIWYRGKRLEISYIGTFLKDFSRNGSSW